MLELVELPAELNGALEVLQAHELDEPLGAAVAQVLEVLVAREAERPARKRARAAYEAKTRLSAHELHVVVVPGVGDGGAVRDDEHLFRVDVLAEVVAREGLAEAGLRVPQELAAVVGAGVVGGLLAGALLLAAQAVFDCGGGVQDAVVLAELVESRLRWRGLYLEPLGVRLVCDVKLPQVAVEVGVAKRLTRVLVCRVPVPLDLR